MKAFFVGLVFLMLVAILAGFGILLFPLLIVLGVVLRLVIYFIFVIFVIWLLGKLIIILWESIRGK